MDVRTYVRTYVRTKSGKPHVGRPLLGPAKINKVVKMVGGGSVINGSYPM